MWDTDEWARLDALVEDRRSASDATALALAIVRSSGIVHSAGFGVTSVDPEQAVAVTPRTVFRIASTTKPLTGTLILRLVEAGKLSLDELVVTSLPYFTLSDREASAHVTIRHLMSHQSGLPWGSDFFGTRDPGGLESYIREQVPRLPLIAPPGLLFSYSNIGIDVLGGVAQAVCGGIPYAELMRTWLFEPLGMERTTFDPLRAMAFPLAQAHEKHGDTIRVKRGEPWAENTAHHPSAMAYSTVLDMANFARLHLGGGLFGMRRLLSAGSVVEMQRTQVDEYMQDGRTVGLTLALTHYRGYRRVGHPGGFGSFGSVFTLLPDADIGVILQFNGNSFWPAAEEIVRHVFDRVLEEAPSPPEVATPLPYREPERRELSALTGTFFGARAGLAVLSISPKENALRLSRPGSSGETILTPVLSDLYTGRNTLTDTDEAVGFPGHSPVSVTHILLNGIPCARIEPPSAFTPEPETWGTYAGLYEGPDETSPSGSDTLTLRCEDGRLIIHSRNRQREEEAIPWDRDCFIYRERFVRFHRDELAEKVSGLSLGDKSRLYRRIQ